MPGVAVDRHAELLARGPDRVVASGRTRRRGRGGRVGRSGSGPRRGARASRAQWISRTASSTSFRQICAMPARRSGASAQKSASQRLCACSPAHRSSYSAVVGGRAIDDAGGEERRDGVGEQHLARPGRRPRGRSSGGRRPSCGSGCRPGGRGRGCWYAPRHASNSSMVAWPRGTSRYWSGDPPPWQSAEMIV